MGCCEGEMNEVTVGDTLQCTNCGVELKVTKACKCDGEDCVLCKIMCCDREMVRVNK